jgi:RNA polymerase sigma-70 factor (ECF subfamily)
LLDDATLLARCRQGDDLAWEALVRRYQGRVYSVAYHYMRNVEEARDAAQEVFIRIYRRLDTFHGGETFLPWMLSLARNCCIDRLRKLKVRNPAGSVTLDDAPQIAADQPSAEDEAGARSAEKLLYRALDRLSDKNREIILLKEIQGLKLEEIAEMLSLPIGTVKSRSNRARVELARKVRVLDPSYGT